MLVFLRKWASRPGGRSRLHPPALMKVLVFVRKRAGGGRKWAFRLGGVAFSAALRPPTKNFIVLVQENVWFHSKNSARISPISFPARTCRKNTRISGFLMLPGGPGTPRPAPIQCWLSLRNGPAGRGGPVPAPPAGPYESVGFHKETGRRGPEMSVSLGRCRIFGGASPTDRKFHRFGAGKCMVSQQK